MVCSTRDSHRFGPLGVGTLNQRGAAVDRDQEHEQPKDALAEGALLLAKILDTMYGSVPAVFMVRGDKSFAGDGTCLPSPPECQVDALAAVEFRIRYGHGVYSILDAHKHSFK